MKNSLISFVVLLFLVPVSQAHVTVVPSVAQAGGYEKLTFRVPHGCNGSPTTGITVKLPPGVLSVKPQVHPGWKISMKKVKLNPPVENHGKQITETVSEVTWDGGVLSDDHMDEFGLSLKMPAKPQEVLAFPVLQKCKKGSADWSEIVTAEHVHHAEFPAPALKLEAAPVKK